MLNVLLLLNQQNEWEMTVSHLISCGANTQIVSDYYEISSIIGRIASLNPDAVIYCFDEKDTYEAELRILLEIRRMNPDITIAVISNGSSREIHQIALDCDVEWFLNYSDDQELLSLLLDRIEKKTRVVKLRKEERMRSILFNYIKDERRVSYQDKVALFQSYPKGPYYQTVIVKILPPYRKRAAAENDNLQILKGRELLDECLSCFEKTNIYEYGHDLLVVAAGEIPELLQIQDTLKEFLSDMKNFSHSVSMVGTWVYVGVVVKNCRDLPISYRSAYEIRDNRLLRSNWEMLEAKPRTAATVPDENRHLQVFDVRKSLSNALATFDEQLIRKSLAQLKSNLISSVEIQGKTVFSIYRTLLSSLIRELERKEINISQTGIDYDSLIHEFEYFWGIDDVFNVLENAYITGINELKNQEEKNAPVQIVLAKRYIRSYFNMPLSLAELSAYVGLNENYFSEYFKKQTGMNFKEYQTDLRIQHAKQMLLDKQYSMDDISDAVGYNDTKYFSRVFKQETGIAPGEYRKKYHIIND